MIPWTVASQAPSTHGDFPGENPGAGGLALLQGIFPIQGSNQGLFTLQADSLLSEPPHYHGTGNKDLLL